MRSYPDLNNKYDQKDLELLKAKEWQLELLKKNPDYPYWGNHEDYMIGENKGWGSPQELETFAEHWNLDDYNEIVNFYFEIYRENHECPHCDGEALNPATKRISDDWYDFGNTGRKWSDKITQDEVYELLKRKRLGDFTDYNGYYDEDLQKWLGWVDGERVEVAPPTPEQIPSVETINQAQHGRGFGHDLINRWICVETRAKRLGVYGHCEHCEGGHIYDEPEARVGLQLWVLHPRKGASRGVYIKNIEEHEVPQVLAYLKEAAERNADRFSKL